MKESYTDGHLIGLAHANNHDAIIEVCYLIVGLIAADSWLRDTCFFMGLKNIGAHKITPNNAFGWMKTPKEITRAKVKKEAMELLATLTLGDIHRAFVPELPRSRVPRVRRRVRAAPESSAGLRT